MANGDIAVIIPGILGSTLRRGDDATWGYGAVTRRLPNLVERLTEALALETADAWDEPHAGAADGTVASGLLRTRRLLPGFWGVEGYDELLRYLNRHFDSRDIVQFPYDWRQSNRVSARRLQQAVEPLIRARRQTTPGARLVLIGHSMGGLVARYYAEVLDRGVGGAPGRNTRRVVTIGTPYLGAARALALLANGYIEVGPLKVDLADLVRNLPSVSELLPTYEAVGPAKAQLEVQGRRPGSVARSELSAITADDQLGGLPPRAWLNCVRFHDEIQEAMRARPSDRPDYRPIVEFVQPTAVWASVEPDGLALHKPDNFEDRGDGTVPRWSATPPEDGGAVAYMTGKHAGLQQTPGVYRQLRGILTERVGQPPTLRAPTGADDQVSAEAPELIEANEPLPVVAESYEGYEDLPLIVAIDDGEPTPMVFDDHTGRYRAEVTGMDETRVHRWVVSSSQPHDAVVDPVSDLVYITERP